MRTMRWGIVCLSAMLAACGSGSRGGGGEGEEGEGEEGEGEGNCVDLDGDGAGIGDGCAANDCDDTDPQTIGQCGEDCGAFPNRLGCPCEAGQVTPCYRGPEGTGDSGGCQAGLQQCEDGAWGTCDGQVLPGVEVCDGTDNDCDGEMDDGVLSACGDCNVDCQSDCIGVDCDAPFDPNEGRSVIEDANGALTLGGEAAILNHVIWIANSGEGTVSKVDTRTREELGRYRTGPTAYPDPSRSTVNPHGDVISCNRQEGSATKILASDCEDQNGDGLQTSAGANDILDWGEEDCVVWHLDGMPGARGTAIELRSSLDGGIHEYAWVGAYNNGIIYEIDSEEGEFTGREIDNVTPYGAALGPGGKLWTFGTWSSIVSIDTETLEREEIAIVAGESWYGLTVDSQGRIWIGGTVARYDPEQELWESPAANVSGGGIAVDADDNVWVGEFGSAWFVDGESLEAQAIPGAGGHGWAVDFDGYAWSIPIVGNSAYVVDPETLALDETVTGFVGSYTYSDMTGFQLVNATNPVGLFPHVFQACEEGQEVHWSQLTCEADEPAGTMVSFRIRIAATLEALPNAAWVDAGDANLCPIDLDEVFSRAGVADIDGHYIEIEATLQSVDRQGRPTLHFFGATHSCESVLG